MTINTDKIAIDYAKNIKWDDAKKCAISDDYVYYKLYAKRFSGKKIGMPAVIKISLQTGKTTNLSSIEEIMWAINQESSQWP